MGLGVPGKPGALSLIDPFTPKTCPPEEEAKDPITHLLLPLKVTPLNVIFPATKKQILVTFGWRQC